MTDEAAASFLGMPVTVDGFPQGTVKNAWVEGCRVMAEIDIDQGIWETIGRGLAVTSDE
jgi:hypothetical protein